MSTPTPNDNAIAAQLTQEFGLTFYTPGQHQMVGLKLAVPQSLQDMKIPLKVEGDFNPLKGLEGKFVAVIEKVNLQSGEPSTETAGREGNASDVGEKLEKFTKSLQGVGEVRVINGKTVLVVDKEKLLEPTREEMIADRLSKIFDVKFHPPGAYPDVEYAELTNGVPLVGKKGIGQKYMATMAGNPWKQEAVQQSMTVLPGDSGSITLNHAHTAYYIDPAEFAKDAERTLGALQQAYVETGREQPEAVRDRVHEGGQRAAAIPGTEVAAEKTLQVNGVQQWRPR